MLRQTPCHCSFTRRLELHRKTE